MGLSVKWASFNLGATAPEDYGYYYAWGEISPKDKYDLESYVGNPDNKYDYDSILVAADDAASYNLKGDWRMPTAKEFRELLSNSDTTWTEVNGVYGLQLKSRIIGYQDSSIFIPAAGYYYDEDIRGKGVCIYSWTSLYNNSFYAEKDYYGSSSSSPYSGYTIRPVVTNPDFVKIENIELDKDTIVAFVGEDVTLGVTITPLNASVKSYSFSVSNPSVATITGNVLTPLKAGFVTIQVYSYDGTMYDACTVTVYESADPADMAKLDVETVYDSFARNVASRGQGFLYSPLRSEYNLMGDDVYAAGAKYGDNSMMSDVNQFSFDSSAGMVRELYTGFYYAIQETNIFIDRFGDSPEAAYIKAVAEAKTLRAYMYMMLAIGWGTPPLIDYVSDGTDKPYNCDTDPDNPLTHEELLEWCAQECEDAIPYLDERVSTEDKEGAYKVTKGFAYSVAGKAYLFAGDYAESKTALDAVITSGKYALVPGNKYWENFHIEGDGNEEKIFEPNLEYDPNVGVWDGPNQKSTWMEANLWNWRSDHFVNAPHRVYTGGADGWGGLGVPQWFGDEFFDNDGHSYRFDATLKRIDDAVYNMEYSNTAINSLTLNEKKESSEIGINDTENGLYGQSFYLPFKQLLRGTDTHPQYGNNLRLNNYTIMRYAEVLLMYAEACLMTGDVAGAKTAINEIQERAGSQTVSTTVDMDVLKREKSYELWLESCRWADIIRWGDTDRIKLSGQTVPKLFDKLFRQPEASDENVQWLDGDNTQRFYTVDTHEPLQKYGADGIGFKEGKHELLPYPLSVIQDNPNITQNPGW